MERYGIRILEGYGVTETAPVLAMNTPMANRQGTVGRISPLMQYRLDPVPGIEEGGRLSVKGPNVMIGYLRVENPGVLEPLPDGWHDTGDIVTVDAQGFIAIKGRAKRFAKIAGEMVSLSAVEAMASALWPQAMSVAVTLPDQRKGERIVLLTTERNADRAAMQRQAKSVGASELSVPADIRVVDKVPLLGMKGTLHQQVYERRGHAFVAEYYADLDYNGDGSLIITREHEAKDPVDAASRCARAVNEGKTRTVAGNDIMVGADSICIHSDTPNAVAIAEAVREAVRPYLTAR